MKVNRHSRITVYDWHYLPALLVVAAGLILILGSAGQPTTNNSWQQNLENKYSNCMSRVTTEDLGQKPTNFKALIKKYMQLRLKDPDSAKYFWDQATDLRKGYAFNSRTLQCPAVGWTMCVPINAKNSYGAYGGLQNYLFVLRDGAVVYSASPDSRGINMNCLRFDRQTL